MREVPTAGEPRPGQVVADRYRLDRPVARGGMAWVLAAHDSLLDRPVALKFPLEHLRSRHDFLVRFRREAVAAARLNHPNVVAVYDTGDDPRLGAYIVMELVPGPSLRQLLREQPILPVDRAVDIATQVATALDFAHGHGVVHRDVKPANVLLDEGRVKVADFGIAKAALGDEGLTKTDVTLGTARYISPEQVEGGSPDARSDLYSLGVVLYEMLCGATPFDADSDLALAVKHLHEQPPLPSLANPDVLPWLDGVILNSLAKAPEQRYQSAAEMRQALLGRGVPARLSPPQVPVVASEVAAPDAPATGPLDADPTRALSAPTRAIAGGAVASPPPAPGPAPRWAASATSEVGPGRAAATIDETPPAGSPGTPPDGSGPGSALDAGGGASGRAPGEQAGKRAVPVVALLVLVAGVALAVAVFGGITASRGGNTGASAGSSGSSAGSALSIAGVRSFDPQGDGVEHDEELGHLIDHDPSTYWETSHYDSAAFGGLKQGVGVVLQLSHPADVAQLSIDSPTPSWTYQVYLSESSPATLSGWGSSAASGRVDSPTTTVSLGGRSAGYVLVWITNLGDGNSSVRIGELSVAS